MERSLREALRLRHGYIGTEHILLSLLTEGGGLAARILSDSGIHANDLRHAVLSALGKVA
jgi:ATP-dependent Clp protease ATP-binding subunit ClpA